MPLTYRNRTMHVRQLFEFILPEGDQILVMQQADLVAVHAMECACQGVPWSQQHFIDELNNPVATIDLYRRNSRIVGFLCTWLVAGEMQIQNIATSLDMRRQGVAARLIWHAIDRYRDGLVSSCLEVRTGNKDAISLYERFGFVVSGTRQGYYPDGEDALLMVWKVKEAAVSC